MASVNKVILVGNVGKDPEVRSLNNGNRVASFSLAMSNAWKDKTTGERKESTDWANVVVFNDNLVKVIESYVKKGSKLFVEGQLKTRKYEKDGSDRYVTEIVLQNFGGQIVLLDSKGDRSEQTGGGDTSGFRDSGSGGFSGGYGSDEDPIPFVTANSLI